MVDETNHSPAEEEGHPGHFLREWREHLKLSQEELGEMASVHYSTIGRYETGKRKLKTGFLRKLARIFGVPASAILEVNPATESGARTANMLLAWGKLRADDQERVLTMVEALVPPNRKSGTS